MLGSRQGKQFVATRSFQFKFQFSEILCHSHDSRHYVLYPGVMRLVQKVRMLHYNIFTETSDKPQRGCRYLFLLYDHGRQIKSPQIRVLTFGKADAYFVYKRLVTDALIKKTLKGRTLYEIKEHCGPIILKGFTNY